MDQTHGEELVRSADALAGRCWQGPLMAAAMDQVEGHSSSSSRRLQCVACSTVAAQAASTPAKV